MVKRLVVGLVLGAVIGALVAAGVIAAFGATTFPSAWLAFPLAAGTGALTGLVAGKPIWASGGQIEAGLKAFVGALLAAGGMYAIRTWLHYEVDLTVARAGHDFIGNLPGASLPLIAAVLGAFYELDNTPEAKDAQGDKGGARVATNVRVADEGSHADEPEAAPVAKKRTR